MNILSALLAGVVVFGILTVVSIPGFPVLLVTAGAALLTGFIAK